MQKPVQHINNEEKPRTVWDDILVVAIPSVVAIVAQKLLDEFFEWTKRSKEIESIDHCSNCHHDVEDTEDDIDGEDCDGEFDDEEE